MTDKTLDIKTVVELKAAFDAYSFAAGQTAHLSPKHLPVVYPLIGLCGETGEVAEKIKKILRDNGGQVSKEQKIEIAKELGDVLWYMASLARDLDIPFHVIPLLNIKKLQDRKDRGVVQGEGDNR